MSASSPQGSPSAGAPFAASGFWVLRTPLLPFDEFEAWGAALEASRAAAHSPDKDDAAVDDAVQRDRQRLRARLRGVMARAEVREALFLASPSLTASIGRWTAEPDDRHGRSLEHSLVRYFSRMAGRPAPFGLFAGYSLGTAGARTQLELGSRDSYRRSTRIDGAWVASLVEGLTRDPELGPQLVCRPNPSLYRVGRQLRYVTYGIEDGRRIHRLAAVDETPALRTILDRAQEGAAAGDLAAALTGETITSDRTLEFVGALLGRRILMLDIEPPVTGRDPLEHLAAQLARAPSSSARRLDGRLTRIRASLDELDTAGVGAALDLYDAASEQLGELRADSRPGALFQVDLRKPGKALNLCPKVVAELARGIDVFARLGRPSEPLRLDAFRQAFRARFERRELPLVDVLDEDVGIGFPQDEAAQAAWGRRDALLLNAVFRAASSGSREVVIAPEEMAELPAAPLPDALAVFGAIAAPSAAAVANGEFLVYVHGLSGASGVGLFTRFARSDPELAALIASHLRREEALSPEAVLAEVAHRPQGRSDNVLQRPLLRAYEIDYLGPSGAPLARRLPASDLLVSVEGERVVLRSARLDRCVQPRLTSAFDVRQSSLPFFRFLMALQNEANAGGFGWSWGPLDDLAFLPRVRVGRIVVHRATWRLAREELAELAVGARAARFRRVAAWRTSQALPRYVVVSEWDRRLPVDFENVMSVEAFVDRAVQQGGATLSELFPGPGELCAVGAEGRFVHELVVPFVRAIAPDASPRSRAGASSATSEPGVRRTVPPGADWVYLKLYGGSAFADSVICDAIAPACRELLSEDAIDAWFFLRFADPDAHVRVRLHGSRAALHDVARPTLERVAARLLDERRLWRVALDTYEREIERYGGPHGMVTAERIFHLDSEAVVAALESGGTPAAPAEGRWRLAIAGVDALLAALGLDASERLGVVERLRDAHARLQRLDASAGRLLGRSFRNERAALEALLDPTGTPTPAVRTLRRGLAQLGPAAEELASLDAMGQLTSPVATVAESFAHMHVNRLQHARFGADELRVYDHLARLYKARLHRSG